MCCFFYIYNEAIEKKIKKKDVKNSIEQIVNSIDVWQTNQVTFNRSNNPTLNKFSFIHI